ncbi:ATP-dependent RNA helicase ROK1 [Cytospora mali]|uniref:ATP-dependent RNA helicase ROK1 n=1 Tax=Cytospora mali TaxID=578113 RepID=A0A194VGC1_CYTMA|nr:ATP-dependent RNA helicase ROK1 [Valsa mali var. pyri (nom. inval.)]
MDIFKLLSIGVTKKRSGPAAAKLPSSGAQTNAQLYHDQVGTDRGTKRKRAAEEGDEESDEDEDGIDFFAPKEVKGAKKKDTAKAKPVEKPKASKTRLLDEDECRQLLRSHRLKFTLLSTGPEKKSKVKKSKKKAKAVAEAKQNKKQLFPQPLRAFGDLRSTYNVSSRLADNLDAQGYREPTEVQMASLPVLLDAGVALGNALGEDVSVDSVDFLAVAPTGSGKTISFLIPAINGIMKRRAGLEDRKKHELEAIVVAPTRELANQILNEARKLTVGLGVKVVAMKKGMRIPVEDGTADSEESQGEDEESEGSDDESVSESDEDDSAAKPVTKADILVTTPMLLLNLLTKGKSNKTLPSVRSLILDEADVLLDQLFRDQTMGIWTACTSPELRLTFWSATMGSNIETIIMDQLKAHSKKQDIPAKPLIRLVVGLKDTAVPNITHKLTYTATEPGKLLALRQLLHPASGADSGPPLRPPFLVFTQTIERASALHDELKYDIPIEAGGSSRIAVLHSSLSDTTRSDIMRRFRLGEIWVLITTDVLARGVDFAGVNGVVNYDVPSSAAAYVHRAGRTGRAGREGGVAVTLYTKEDIPYVKSVANVIAMSEKQAGKTNETSAVPQWLLDALPNVNKESKKKLKTGGVESRKTAKITSKSGWERKKEHNKREAIKESKKRKKGDDPEGGESDWGGLDD